MTEILTTRIRATFGPMHLVSLYRGRWAAVWYQAVSDEAVARLILAEDATWFNVEPDAEGITNPTFADKADALQAIVQMLRYQHSKYPTDASLLVAIDDAINERIYAEEERHAATLPVNCQGITHPEPPFNLGVGEVPGLCTAEGVMAAAMPQDSASVDVEETTLAQPDMQDRKGSSGLPWENTTGLRETQFQYKMSPEVVAQMNWVIDHVPKMSRQRIVREAVEAYLIDMLAKHYKAGGDGGV